MELLKKDKQWFLSEEGGKAFAALTSIGDRAVFLYSYLVNIASDSLEKQNATFKTAFLLADAVYGSDVEYSSYENLLNEKTNPFVAFLANAKRKYTDEQLYCIYLSFIHGVADPFKKDEWIYNDEYFKGDAYIRKLEEGGYMFVVPNDNFLPDPSAYECDEKYNMIQLEIVWLFSER